MNGNSSSWWQTQARIETKQFGIESLSILILNLFFIKSDKGLIQIYCSSSRFKTLNKDLCVDMCHLDCFAFGTASIVDFSDENHLNTQTKTHTFTSVY